MKSLIFHVKKFGFFSPLKVKRSLLRILLKGCEIIHFKKDYFDGNAKTDV